MRKGIKKLLTILGIILAIGIVIFLCKDPIVNIVFYDMDAEMDLPKDLKTDPKYAPSSSSKEDKKDATYETEEQIGQEESEQVYTVEAKSGLSLRTSPEATGDTITKLEYKTEVIVIDDSTAPFVEVKLVNNPDLRGYLNEEYLEKKK